MYHSRYLGEKNQIKYQFHVGVRLKKIIAIILICHLYGCVKSQPPTRQIKNMNVLNSANDSQDKKITHPNQHKIPINYYRKAPILPNKLFLESNINSLIIPLDRVIQTYEGYARFLKMFYATAKDKSRNKSHIPKQIKLAAQQYEKIIDRHFRGLTRANTDDVPYEIMKKYDEYQCFKKVLGLNGSNTHILDYKIGSSCQTSNINH